MPETLFRAQILLERSQHAELKRLAEREGRSLSDLARELIAIGLDRRKAGYEQRLDALKALDVIREGIEERYGVFDRDFAVEARRDLEARTPPFLPEDTMAEEDDA